MKERDNSKIHTYKQQLYIVYMSSNIIGHLITKTITTLQHFATLHHTSPNYTSLYLSMFISEFLYGEYYSNLLTRLDKKKISEERPGLRKRIIIY